MQNPLNQSPLAFPVLECIHIVGFICGVGTIAVVNFRLLGVGLMRRSTVQLWRDALPWTLAGLTLVISSGLLLFSVNPDVYYLNSTFVLKMSVLAAAIVFYFTAVRGAAAGDRGRLGRGRLAAAVSLLLWTLVLAGGVFIGLSATRPPPLAPAPAGVDFDQFLNPPSHP